MIRAQRSTGLIALGLSLIISPIHAHAQLIKRAAAPGSEPSTNTGPQAYQSGALRSQSP